MRSSFIQNAMSLNPSLSQNRIDIFVRDNDSSRASCIEGGDDLTFSTTSSSDQFYYIIKIIRFPTILRWFIFLYLIFQILAIPVTFHMINLTSDNDFLHNFFRIVGYSSLTLAPDADAPYFMPLFIALIAIHVVEFLIFIVSDVFYWKFRYIPKPLCYITLYSSAIISTIFLPCTSAFCARYFYKVFTNRQVSSVISFIVFLLQLFVIIRSLYFLCCFQFLIPYDEMLFRVFYPVSIPRIYCFVTIMVFLKNAINNTTKDFRILYFVLAFFLIVEFFFDLLEQSWIVDSQLRILTSSLVISTVFSLILAIDLFIESYINISRDFLISIIADVFIILIIQKLNKLVVDAALYRLSQEKYHHRVKFAKTAFTDLNIGLKYCHKDVIGCTYILKLLKKFNNEFTLLVWTARYLLLFNNCPLSLEMIYYEMSLTLRKGYHPLKRNAMVSLARIVGPFISTESEKYNKEYKKIQHIFSRVLFDTRDLYDVIVDENWTLMPKFISYYDYDLLNLTSRLLYFIQRYGNTPHAQFLIDLYQCFFPLSKELKLLKEWQKISPVNLKNYLSLFPNLLNKSFLELVHPYRPSYDSITKKLIPEVPPNLRTTKKEKKRKHDGPNTRLMYRPFVLIIFAFTFLWPLVTTPLRMEEDQAYLYKVNVIIQGHSLMWRFARIEAKIWPFYIFRNDSMYFWMYQTKEAFKQQILDENIIVQNLLTDFSYSRNNLNINKNHEYLQHISDFVNFVNVSTIYYQQPSSVYQSLLATTFLIDEIISYDKILLKNIEDTNSTETEYLLTTMHDQLTNDFMLLRSLLINSDRNYLTGKMNNTEFLIVSLVSLIVSFFIILLVFYIAKKNMKMFMTTIKDTSQTAITSSKHFVTMCLGIINSKTKTKKTKSSLTSYVLILPFLFVALAVCHILEYELSECFLTQVDRLQQLHSDFALAYSNISLSASKCCQLKLRSPYDITKSQSDDLETKSNKRILETESVDEIKNDINVLIDEFVKFSWSFYDDGSSFCPLCTNREMYLLVGTRGITYEKIIYNYLAEISILKDLSILDSTWDQRLQSAMQQYFFAVDQALANFVTYISDVGSNYYNRTKDVQIALIIIYVILAFATILMIAFVTYRLDKSFLHLSRLLGRLPDSALSAATLKILKKSSWRVKDSSLTLDNSLYESILRTEPDIVIVIDKALDVIYLNDSALSITKGSIPGSYTPTASQSLPTLQQPDQTIFQQSPLHVKWKGKKLFDALNVKLVDEYGQSIKELLSNYIFENKELAETHKLTAVPISNPFNTANNMNMMAQNLNNETGQQGFQHRSYYMLTILPLFEENNQKGSQIALILRDIGDEQRQQNLLSAETAKHLSILQKILPGPIARKLLSSQRSISMTVEKVTISFCDIVSFTPWCGSQTAEFVVRCLNEMFNLFDEKCNQYETMTKIKCIGDCYMSASGIFNQSPKFGTEMCLFGADMISQIHVLNAKMGTTLRIRVGAALGGPISAGVMGIHKPVFDVWGETVNEAQNMESGGVPMRVHINAPLFEICDTELFIHERREDGTYLLQSKADLESNTEAERIEAIKRGDA